MSSNIENVPGRALLNQNKEKNEMKTVIVLVCLVWAALVHVNGPRGESAGLCVLPFRKPCPGWCREKHFDWLQDVKSKDNCTD